MSGELEEILPANVSIFCNLTELQGSRDIMLEQTDKVSLIIQVSGVTIFTTGEGVGSQISKMYFF